MQELMDKAGPLIWTALVLACFALLMLLWFALSYIWTTARMKAMMDCLKRNSNKEK